MLFSVLKKIAAPLVALALLAIAAVSKGQWQVDLERRLQRLDRRLGVDERAELALTG